MTATPTIVRGARQIADRLGIKPRELQHMIRHRHVPVWNVGGTPYATAAGLDDWQALNLAGQLPTK